MLGPDTAIKLLKTCLVAADSDEDRIKYNKLIKWLFEMDEDYYVHQNKVIDKIVFKAIKDEIARPMPRLTVIQGGRV